jgi:hypothetical protein
LSLLAAVSTEKSIQREGIPSRPVFQLKLVVAASTCLQCFQSHYELIIFEEMNVKVIVKVGVRVVEDECIRLKLPACR